MQRTYSWYKHHAWAALAMLTLFFALTQFFDNFPKTVTLIAVGIFSIYALIAILFTYKHNKEHTIAQQASPKDKDNDGISYEHPNSDNESEKLIKKRLKVEQKALKKSR